MSRFRRNKKQMSFEINTASLPDLVFTVLFFFMITSHFQTMPNRVKIDLPTATELQKLQERSLIIHIMAGQELAGQSRNAGASRIQLNNEIIALEQLPDKLRTLKATVPEPDRPQLMSILKIDKSTPMGIVTDIKKHLREAGVLTIHYSATKKP
ncbi:biopolymer transporter ExbD [Bacteroidia bacterium]|nr:biopolymer transporter ExbD [Bacteroidia bacterium]